MQVRRRAQSAPPLRPVRELLDGGPCAGGGGSHGGAGHTHVQPGAARFARVRTHVNASPAPPPRRAAQGAQGRALSFGATSRVDCSDTVVRLALNLLDRGKGRFPVNWKGGPDTSWYDRRLHLSFFLKMGSVALSPRQCTDSIHQGLLGSAISYNGIKQRQLKFDFDFKVQGFALLQRFLYSFHFLVLASCLLRV